MAHQLDALRAKGVRLTPQRTEVYLLLCQKEHLSAEEIFHSVQKKLPMVSFATVYSILQSLKKHGFVQEIRITYDKSLFEAKVEPHHHFLCRKCKRVFDIDRGPCPQFAKAHYAGHTIESFQGYFYGICSECSKK